MTDESKEGERPASVAVAEFARAEALGLDLQPLQDATGLENRIASPRIQKLGLALAGYARYIHPGRVQILGGSELNYLNILGPDERSAAVHGLRGHGICCIVVTRGLQAPGELIDVARSDRIPVFRTQSLSSVAITRIGNFLESRLAPRTTIHGVLMEVFGLGILLLGPSGIGKSECGLELILRGHRLVADDFVEIIRRGLDCLVGSGGPVLKHHIEVRGLGIIDIKEIFGISATGQTQPIDLVVRLTRWIPDAEYDRLGLERSTVEFLGVDVPALEIPVAPGRNISSLIEVAARVQLLRQRGFVPSRELHEDMFLSGEGDPQP
ncbi:MAG: HPr(Ser) kinase/phosphatase [Acidobacteriota bacterium]